MSKSLSELIAQHLGKELLKDQQCSDWSCRPWSAEQLRYAALDAHALLLLLASRFSPPASSPKDLCEILSRSQLQSMARPRFVPLGPEAVDAALRTLNLPIREVVHLAYPGTGCSGQRISAQTCCGRVMSELPTLFDQGGEGIGMVLCSLGQAP
eukprot:symbB.v1.2.004055.t1/scaffold228.1/size260974/24